MRFKRAKKSISDLKYLWLDSSLSISLIFGIVYQFPIRFIICWRWGIRCIWITNERMINFQRTAYSGSGTKLIWIEIKCCEIGEKLKNQIEWKRTQLTFLVSMHSFLVESHDSLVLLVNLLMVFRPCQENHHVSNDSHRTLVILICVRLLSLWIWILHSKQDLMSV